MSARTEFLARRRRVVYLAAALLVMGAMIGSASAAKGGRHQQDPACSVSPNPAAVGTPYVLSATGIPSGIAVNLWVTNPSGQTSGSPLGSTGDGTFDMIESSSSAGTWTYTFSGPTKNNPDTTSIYARCSVDAY